MSTQIQNQNPRCPKCNSAYVVKKGKRRNRRQTIPLLQCNECQHRFTGNPGRNKSYPLRQIFEALSLYNLGHSISETQRILRGRMHIDIPEGTIRSWLAAHKSLTTYARLRAAGRRLFEPANVLRSYALMHQQVYQFQIHRPKLRLLLESPTHRHLAAVQDYLEGVNARFPHDLFLRTDHRSSTFPATINPPISRKENHATRLAALAVPTSPTNTKRQVAALPAHQRLRDDCSRNTSLSHSGGHRVFPRARICFGLRQRRYHRPHRFLADSQRLHSHPRLQTRVAEREARACAAYDLRVGLEPQSQPPAQ